ncbi:helix-turn-helix domain-containing protein [Anaerotignum sp.]|uniref:helix-turn-helix domain-containing protein n=1 Tax=Anaerotignum sp. TaxID=2039241 RepID=UPI00373519BF
MKIYEYDGKKNICGEQIRKIRMEKKMSQAALSRALQLEGITIDRYSICRMEKGERFIADYELIKIAGILGVSVASFFPLAEDE